MGTLGIMGKKKDEVLNETEDDRQGCIGTIGLFGD